MWFTRAGNIKFGKIEVSTSNRCTIERVTEIRYLDVWLDEELKNHVNTLATQLLKRVGYLYKNESCFPRSCRKRIVAAMFLSV